MIEYIKGSIESLSPTQAVLETSGIGYALNISLNTYTSIRDQKETKLYVYESIRDDAYQLYGFSTTIERSLFLLLINVPGIGGQTARMILSAFVPEDLARIIQNGDERALKSVKGIGPKAAQRIIVDMKDKIVTFIDSKEVSAADNSQSQGSAYTQFAAEAEQALVVLGFSPAAVRKVILKILKDEPDAKVEDMIKKALKLL